MEGLKITGLEDLNEKEQQAANELIQKNYEKLMNHLGDDIKVSVTLKAHKLNKENEEKRHKYSITLKVEAKTKMFKSDKNSGFEIYNVIKNAFKDIEEEVNKKFNKA